MKIYLVMLLLITLKAFSGQDQYPEERVYSRADRGLRPYQALSIYKTGTFALTFDDGPHPTRTAQILDVLKKYQVKALFFVLTSKINESTFPIIKRMLDEGHLIGSHGVTHDRGADLTESEWKFRVKRSFIELAQWHKKAGYEYKKHYYRFPFGDYGTRADYHHINALKEISRELMGENCIHMAFWDVDTADWVPGMTPEEVAQNMIVHNEGGLFIDFKKVGDTYVKNPIPLKNPPSGGVILLHDIQEPSVKATELFIQYAQERSLHLPRIDEIEEFRITRSCSL